MTSDVGLADPSLEQGVDFITFLRSQLEKTLNKINCVLQSHYRPLDSTCERRSARTAPYWQAKWMP